MRSYSCLQSLRGIFALFIFFHHLDLFKAGGDSGVGFFIILSGFVISAGYHDKISTGIVTHKDFLHKRVKRLFSYHLIGFILALLIMSPFYGWKTPLVWTANILMLQSWIPTETFYFSCDSPSWCLSDLVFCYAVFPAIIMAMMRMSQTLRLTAGAALFLLYFIAVNLLPESLWNPLIYINPLFRTYDFLLGIILWSVFSSPEGKKSSGWLANLSFLTKSFVETAVIGLFIVCIILYPDIPERYGLASYWWLPSLAIIYCFASLDSNGGFWTRLLNSEALIWFGNLSFAFYMIHYPMIEGVRKALYYIFPETMPELGESIPALIIIFLFTVLLSVAVYYKIEPKIASLISFAHESGKTIKK